MDGLTYLLMLAPMAWLTLVCVWTARAHRNARRPPDGAGRSEVMRGLRELERYLDRQAAFADYLARQAATPRRRHDERD